MVVRSLGVHDGACPTERLHAEGRVGPTRPGKLGKSNAQVSQERPLVEAGPDGGMVAQKTWYLMQGERLDAYEEAMVVGAVLVALRWGIWLEDPPEG